MASINQVTLIGYLGGDPQITTTTNGVKVARISIGTTERGYKTKDGKEVAEKTEWHDVTLWRFAAEFAEKYVKKGAQVYVQGKLRHRKYEDKNGQTKYATDIEAETFELLDRAAKNNQDDTTPVQPKKAAPVSRNDSDLPF